MTSSINTSGSGSPQTAQTESALISSSISPGATSNAVVIYKTPFNAIAIRATPETIAEAYEKSVKNSKIYIAKQKGYIYEFVELPKRPEVCPTCGPSPSPLQALTCLSKSSQTSVLLFGEIFWKTPLFTYEPGTYHATTLSNVSDLFARITRGERVAFDPFFIIKDKNGKEHKKENIYFDNNPDLCGNYTGSNVENNPVLIGVNYHGTPCLDEQWQKYYTSSSLVEPQSCRPILGNTKLHPLCQPAKDKLTNMGKAGAKGLALGLAAGTGALAYKYRSEISNFGTSVSSTLRQSPQTEPVSDTLGAIGGY